MMGREGRWQPFLPRPGGRTRGSLVVSHRTRLVRKSGRQPDTPPDRIRRHAARMTTSADERGEFTRLLEQVRDGDQHAFDRLLAIVYETLKEIARRQLSVRRRGSALS